MQIANKGNIAGELRDGILLASTFCLSCVCSSFDGLLLIIGEGILGEAADGLALEVEDVRDGTAGQSNECNK